MEHVEQSYPGSWAAPALAVGNNCPNVAGVFQTKGESADAQWSTNLVIQLFGRTPDWNSVDRVTLRFVDSDHLLIEALLGSRPLHTTTLVRGSNQFTCEDGYVVLRRKGFDVGEGVIEWSASTLHLALSNGALVVKENKKEIGVLYIVPGGGRVTAWTRYRSPQ